MQLFLRRSIAMITLLVLSMVTVLALLVPVDRQVTIHWLAAPLLLILALTGLFFLVHGYHWLMRRPHSQNKLSWLLVVLVLAIQGWLAWQIVGMGSLDPAAVRMQAAALARGQQHWFRYFSWYPNNVNITVILAGIMHLTGQIQGVAFGRFLNVLLFLHIDLAIGLVWHWLYRHYSQTAATFSLVLLPLFLPFFGYALDFYTDGLVLPYPLLLLTCVDLAYQQKKSLSRYCWLGGAILAFMLGYLIKGNTIVFGIAALLGWWLLRPLNWRRCGQIVLVAGLALVLLWAGNAGSKQLARSTGYQPQAASVFPTRSWMLMGLNPTSFGTYSQSDIDATTRLGSVQANKTAVDQALWRRLKHLGPFGLLRQFYRKTVTMWSTGTMGMLLWPDSFTKIPQVLLQRQTQLRTVIANFSQVIYLILLSLAWWTVWKSWREPTFGQLFFELGLLGIFLLHVLFWEVEARYAFLAAPFLFGLASGSPLDQIHLWRQNRLYYAGLIGLMVANLYGYLKTASWSQATSQTNPVTMQPVRSYFQMSQLQVQPGQQLVQTIKIPQAFNQIQTADIATSGKALRLTLQQKQHHWVAQQPGQWMQKTLLPAGKYQLKLKNTSRHTVAVSVTHSPLLKLATTPAATNGYYFRYTVNVQTTAALVPASGRIALLGVNLSGLLGLAIKRKNS
ncbi:glycosyltransferase family protein [Loigolactobacillus binensis]|uniref:Glycosyltransferase RgtA/B/C/D-like domain-containing protein n=1 Tax=Loigolactobacillus binensis TaxID=2559922 RepID=A0ABW3EE76_9LACO|nr:hypothetical protein [Loigolactobacillus binensis]